MIEYKHNENNNNTTTNLIDLIVAPSGDPVIGKKYGKCLTIKFAFDKNKVLVIFPLIGYKRPVSIKKFLNYINEKNEIPICELLKSTIDKDHVDSYIFKVYEAVDFVASFSFPFVKDMINFNDVVENYYILYLYFAFLVDYNYIKNETFPNIILETVKALA
jgi:hypothetical protein